MRVYLSPIRAQSLVLGGISDEVLRVRQQEYGEIVVQCMSDEDLVLDEFGDLTLALLERHRRLRVQVLRPHATHGGTIVRHRLRRLHVLVIHHGRMEVDDTHTSQRILRTLRADTDELAIDGEAGSHAENK